MTLPYRYQLHGVRRMHQLDGRVLLGDDMGLGKTYQALLYAQRHPALRPVVVVCPASIKWVWEREAMRHVGMRAEVLEGTRPHKGSGFKSAANLTIVNYDILPFWLDYLRGLKPKLVVVDECFPAQTKVLTTDGWISIGTLVKKRRPVLVASFDLATNALVYRPILRYLEIQRTQRIVTVLHSKGSLTCTENHKIWTRNRGYVKAINLKADDTLLLVRDPFLSKEEKKSLLQLHMRKPLDGTASQRLQPTASTQNDSMQKMRTTLPRQRKRKSKVLFAKMLRNQRQNKSGENVPLVSTKLSRNAVPTKEAQVLPGDLLREMGGCSTPRKGKVHRRMAAENKRGEHQTIPNLRRQKTSTKKLDTNEKVQSNEIRHDPEESRKKGQNIYRPGRKREADQAPTSNRQTDGPANRICDRNEKSTSAIQLSAQKLQGRSSPPIVQNGHRNRRGVTPNKEMEIPRQTKNGGIELSRVDSVTIHEPRSPSKPQKNQADNSSVYCLEIQGTHNFFADGILVSNCHYCGSRRTRRTKAVQALCRGVPAVLALSGTPLVNRPVELWPTLNILRPKTFPSYYGFCHKFCSPRRTPWGWDFRGASNLKELNNLLKGVMIRRRKVDVLKDLPAKRRAVVPLEIRDRDQYDRAVDDFLGWLAEHSPGRLFRAARAQALVKLGYLKRLAGRLKLPSVCGWIDDFLEQGEAEKLIVFAVHRKVIGRLHRRYAGASVVVDGSITGRKRRLAVEQFLKSPRTRIFIGNIKAAGVGWSAKGVSNVAFAELPWTPGELVQAEDRCHGLERGEKGRGMMAWYLVGRGTVEEKLAKLLQEKQKTLRRTLDGDNKGENLDIYERLCAELQKGSKP